jgi:hypothetical protein
MQRVERCAARNYSQGRMMQRASIPGLGSPPLHGDAVNSEGPDHKTGEQSGTPAPRHGERLNHRHGTDASQSMTAGGNAVDL